MWHIRFHHDCDDALSVSNLFVRVSSATVVPANVWRTAGAGYKMVLALAKASGAFHHIPDAPCDPVGCNSIIMIEIAVDVHASSDTV